MKIDPKDLTADPVFEVALDADRIVPVDRLFVRFRAGARLSDPHVVRLARQHAIPLRPARA